MKIFAEALIRKVLIAWRIEIDEKRTPLKLLRDFAFDQFDVEGNRGIFHQSNSYSPQRSFFKASRLVQLF